MATWRTAVISTLVLVTVSGLTVSLSGCGSSAPKDGVSNPEVKIEPVRDASGKEYRIEDEAKTVEPPK